MKLLLLISVLLLSVACGKKSSGHSKKVNQIFVKGNPLTMVNGTTKNSTSFITTSNIHDFKDYILSGIYIFAEKELLSNEESEDIEAGQEAEERDRTDDDRTVFNMKYNEFGAYSFEDSKGDIELELESESNRFNVRALRLKNSRFPLETIHYSISPDRSKMSFLFKIVTKQDGNVLLSTTFYKNSSKRKVPTVSSTYHYLYGKGVVVPWKLDASRQVVVDVCPSEELDFDDVKTAFQKWELPFIRSKKLDIVVNSKESCKPFSDVNEHGIQYISKYLTMPDKNAYNPGFAMVHADLQQGYIFDADIMILGSEIKKDPNYTHRDMARTLTHEFGHFLGLDHQFDGYYSIMSYNPVYTLGTYDMNAIQNLYQ